MASQKKVVVRQFDATLLWGYLPALNVLQDSALQLLDTSGRVQPVDLKLVKTICFVRDFNLNDHVDPERVGRRTFAGRPRGEGLWLGLRFSDQDTIEGLAPFDSTFLDHLVEDRCLGLTPPDPKSNCYMMLVPRSALVHVELLGLIASRQKRIADTIRQTTQSNLFGN